METPAVVQTLVANHRAFLAFVERRVGNRALAEEIVQEALVKSLDKAGSIEETAIGWFYRVLRNAIIDHQRRQAVATKRLEALAVEPADDDAELHAEVCRCVKE